MRHGIRHATAIALLAVAPGLSLGAPPAAPMGLDAAMKQLLDTSLSPKERRAAASQLVKLKDPKSIPTLIKAFYPEAGSEEDIWFVRNACVQALIAIGPAALPPLKESLKATDVVVRFRSVQTIARLRQPDVIEFLEKQVKSDPAPEVRKHCLFELRDLKLKKAVPIIQAVARDDKDPDVKETAAKMAANLQAGKFGALK